VLPISRPSLPDLDDYVRLLEDIWRSRMLSNFARHATLFEEKAQKYLDNPLTRAVVNCDIGLVLSIAALGIPRGGECLVQSFTFNSTINAILWNGLVPVFVDIDPRTFNVDLADLERKMGPSIRAITVTHVFGSPLPIDRVMARARAADVPVVVDAAHAYGARFHGMPIGSRSLGDFQVFSFSGTKALTSAEGGLVAAGNEELLETFEYLRAYGFQHDYVSRYVGLNGKMSEIHAALACLTVDRADEVVAIRQGIAAHYRSRLGAVPGLRFQEVLPDCVSTYKDFAIVCPSRRDELAAHLESEGIQTKKYFLPLHQMPLFEPYRRSGDELPGAGALASKVLCLPIFNDIVETDVDRVCDAIVEFYRS
jgi:dTDP-4-amino-4,6-dideoxy-D-glucose transaminase